MKGNIMVLLDLARGVEVNAQKEAEAVYEYTQLKGSIEIAELEKDDKEYAMDLVDEIIADELNHQKRLQEFYTRLTKIKANKD